MPSPVEEAIDRSGSQIRDIKSYINMRRDTIGGRPMLVLIELGLNIPDEVVSHPVIEDLITATDDMIWLTNVSGFSVDVNDIHDNAR